MRGGFVVRYGLEKMRRAVVGPARRYKRLRGVGYVGDGRRRASRAWTRDRDRAFSPALERRFGRDHRDIGVVTRVYERLDDERTRRRFNRGSIGRDRTTRSERRDDRESIASDERGVGQGAEW